MDYRELREGLKQLGVEVPDDKFHELCELIDADRSGSIDYQEFANADVMGSRLFKARSIQGHSAVPTASQLHHRRLENLPITAPGSTTRPTCMAGRPATLDLDPMCRTRAWRL